MKMFWSGFLYCYFVLNLISLTQVKYMVQEVEKENKLMIEAYKGLKIILIIMSSTVYLLVGVLLSLRGAHKFMKNDKNN